MGRWDALNSENTEQRCKARFRKRNPNQPQRRSTIVETFNTLEMECGRCASPSASKLIQFCTLVTENLSLLPIAKVRRTLEPVFLQRVTNPILLPEADIQRLVPHLLLLLKRILESEKYLSATMGSLVQDITDSGNEEQAPNPLRLAIFGTLAKLMSNYLKEKVMVASTVDHLCLSLKSAFDAAFNVDGNKGHGGTVEFDVDPKLVLKFVLKCMSTPKSVADGLQTKEMSICMLESFLSRHPNASPSLSVELLTGCENNRGESCPKCGLPRSSLFLETVHSGNREVQRAGISCVALLVNGSPFDLWLRQHRQQQSGFQRRAAIGSHNVLRLASCPNLMDPSIDSSHKLVSAVLAKFPPGDPSSQLGKLSLQFLDATVDNLLLSGSKTMASAMVESTGGKMTPSGSLTPISPLLEVWLSSDKAKNLQDLVRESFTQAFCSKVLQAFVRNKPGLLANKNFRCEFVRSLSTSVNLSLDLEVIEAVLAGRLVHKAELDDDDDKGLLLVFLPKLDASLKEGVCKAQQRLACAGLGWLRSADWNHIAEDMHYIHQVVSICTKSELNAKLRSEACKAVGDICSEFFNSDSKNKGEAFGMVAEAMGTVARDKNALVRSMALFCIGNLSLVAGAVGSPVEWVKVDSIVECLRSTIELLCDHDDKVVGNAIRSLGHLTFITWQHSALQTETLEKIMFSLNGFVYPALACSTTCTAHQHTWKQRSALRKKAWGAANALGRVFELHDTPNTEIHRESVSLLLKCVAEAERLHEKILLAAANSLRKITCTELANQGRLLVSASKQCAFFLLESKPRRISVAHYRDLVCLLLHLLRSLNQNGTKQLLIQLTNDEAQLESLCDKMVTNAEVEVLEKFAVALASPDVAVGPRVEQHFAAAYMQLVLGENSIEDEL